MNVASPTIVHIAWVRVSEDAKKVRRYQWIALNSDGGSLESLNGPVALVAEAWPPLTAGEVSPLVSPWSGYDWVAAIDATLVPE